MNWRTRFKFQAFIFCLRVHSGIKKIRWPSFYGIGALYSVWSFLIISLNIPTIISIAGFAALAALIIFKTLEEIKK